MTRKDFELIADVLRRKGPNDQEAHLALVLEFADRLATTNPNFDRQRFLHAARAD